MRNPPLAPRSGARRLVVIQAAELSLSARVRAIDEAFWARNRNDLSTESWYSIDVHDTWVMARRGEKTFKVPYTMDDDAKVTFGEPEEVEAVYVPVEAAMTMNVAVGSLHLAAAEAELDDVDAAEGLVWDVDVIRAGMSSTCVTLEDGRQLPVYFTEEWVQDLVPLLANAPVFALDHTHTGHATSAAEKPQGNSVGWTAEPRYRDGVAAATLHFDAANPLAQQKAADLKSAWARGNRKRWGLSIDARGTGDVRRHKGQDVYFATQPGLLLSTDLVLRPAAGGGFNKLLASSRGPHHTDEESMKYRERLIAAIRASRPQLLEGKDMATLAIGELAAMANETELRAAAVEQDSPAPAAAPPAAAGAAVPLTAAEIATQVHQALALRGAMERVVTESLLPAKAQATLRAAMNQPGATVESVQAAADNLREMLAEAAPPRISGLGGPGAGSGVDLVIPGVEPIDKLQAALDRAFGMEPVQTELKTIKPIGLMELYNHITCGQDQSVMGAMDMRGMRAVQAAGFDESTLPTLMENTLNRRLTQDYGELDYGEQHLVSTEGSIKDFRPQTALRLGYLGNIPVVDTEVSEYATVAAYGQERAIWEPSERGIIIEISRKHIINDDLSAVAKIPGRIARAGKRTVAEFVFDFIASNPVLSLSVGDTLTWFHAARNNLITDALSVPALNKARLILAMQQEPSSNKRMGLPKNVQLHLWIPPELGETARAINQSQLIPGSANNDANPWYHKFGVNDEFIHEVYSFTDVNNWALSVDAKEREIIEVKYLNGQTTPQVVRQDAPGVGKVFTQGKISLKAFFDFGGTPVDFRGIVLSVPV